MIENVNDSLADVAHGQTLVTDLGYVWTENVKEGDKILSYKGDYRTVTEVIEGNERDSYYDVRVNGFFGYLPVLATNQVLTYRGKRSSRGVDKLRWVNSSELKPGDMVIFNTESKPFEDSFINKYENKNDLATFLGYYTLEGFINHNRGKIAFHLDPDFPAMEEEIKTSCQKVFNVEMEKYNYIGENFLSVEGEEIIELCSKFGDKNKDRIIPEDIINADITFLNYYTSPFLNLNKDKRGSYFRPSASVGAFMGYKRILMRFGSFTNIYFCTSKDGKFTYYALVMNKKEYQNALNLDESEGDNWFKKDKLVYMRVDEVEKREKKIKTRRIRVEGEGSYCNYIIFCR